MIPLSIVIISTLVLFSGADCRLHTRHRILRQQAQPAYPSLQQTPVLPAQPDYTQTSSAAFPYISNVANEAPAPMSPAFPEPAVPPALPSSPEVSPLSTYTVGYILTAPIQYTPPQPRPGEFSSEEKPNYNPRPIFGNKRRRKNVLEKTNHMDDLLENGKKLLESATEDVQVANRILGLNESSNGDNATYIHIPKGLQLKSRLKKGNGQIDETVNITSSTQRTVLFGNSTEIENVVEMEMEKKIEDDKGANRGSEEVRIVERERVSPLANNKLSNLHLRHRKRKSYRKTRFVRHHRSKRSILDSTDSLVSNSIFNKMAKNFFSIINRKERVVETSGLSSHESVTTVPVKDHSNNPNNVFREGEKSSNYQPVRQKGVIGDFMHFFVKEMKKLKKFQEGNSSKPMRHLNVSRKWSSKKAVGKKMKKSRKNPFYPERMNIIMNMNMTWESKMKEAAAKPRESVETATMTLATSDTPRGSATEQMRITLYFFKDDNGTDFKFLALMLFLSVISLIVAILAWIVPRFQKTGQIAQKNSAVRTYQFYHDGQRGEVLELDDFANEKELTEDLPRLEWQSELGDWLSDREADFK